MANSKVSALTAKATPVTADTIYLVDSSDGSSKKCTLLQMFAAASPTLTTPVIATGGYIADTNGNEALVFTTTSSAVNEVTLVNAAAGSNATILASGTGTSPGLDIAGKAGASATNPGGTVVVVGGAGNTTGAGGLVSLTGGAGGNDAVGGSATLKGGAAGGGNRAGGAALVTGGAGAGTAAGGAVTLTSGASANGSGVSPGASGAITLQVGAAGTATTGTAGAGGTVSLLGVAGGASTGASSTAGAGSSIVITAGAGGASSGGSDTAGAGGNVTITAGAAGAGATNGRPGAIFFRGGLVIRPQGAPSAKTTSATLTAAEVLAGIITINQGAGATSAQQLPTGSDLDAALSGSMAAGDAFDISVINISTVGAEDATITTNTNMTLVGDMNFSANDAVTARSSGILRIRKTAANTFSVYRLA